MNHSGHVVAVIGGAVAGSEAVLNLTKRGIRCVVFEQNALPYGKLESGLPKWHIKLRDKQESIIDQHIDQPMVHFIPKIRLGQDLSFDDLHKEWGFSAILLATGAWRDRPLELEGISSFLNNGFYYQNQFVEWFNKNHDPNFNAPACEIEDNAVIIGGGLASIDVAKIIMTETVKRALAQKNIITNVLELEKKGIAAFLVTCGLAFRDLGLKGCTLFYRRRAVDMPLSSLPDNPTEKDVEQAWYVRKKILDNVQGKFLFNIADSCQPVAIAVSENRLDGLVFQRTETKAGVLSAVSGSEFTVRSPLIVSAIGSLPEEIPGLPYTGSTFDVVDAESGLIRGFKNVFALGNAVTGRGNIRESQLHGRQVAERVMEEYLVWQEADYREIFERATDNAGAKIHRIARHLQSVPQLDDTAYVNLLGRVKDLQKRVNYNGNYSEWIRSHLPVRLETLV